MDFLQFNRKTERNQCFEETEGKKRFCRSENVNQQKISYVFIIHVNNN